MEHPDGVIGNDYSHTPNEYGGTTEVSTFYTDGDNIGSVITKTDANGKVVAIIRLHPRRKR